MPTPRNVKFMTVKGKLMIEIDLNAKSPLSASGKSFLIATTAGNVDVPGTEDVKIGINCYRPNKEAKAAGA